MLMGKPYYVKKLSSLGVGFINFAVYNHKNHVYYKKSYILTHETSYKKPKKLSKFFIFSVPEPYIICKASFSAVDWLL